MALLLAPQIVMAQFGTTGAPSIADYHVNPNARTFAADSGNYGTRPSGGANGNHNSYFNYGTDGNFYHSGINAGGVRMVPGSALWWYVDLGSNYDVSSLTFTFRSDCCPNQNDGDWLELWTNVPTFNGIPSSLFSQTIQYTGSPTETFTSASPVTARYASISAGAGSHNGIVLAELDVVGVATTATPEPATIGLFGTGLLGLICISRRKRAA